MNREKLERRLRYRSRRDPRLRDARAASVETAVSLWLVGGAVRDAALGRRGDDLDFAAGRGASRLIAVLERLWSRRAFRFRKRRVTTWRFEIEGLRVDVVDAGGRGIERDLRRRELTVNAVAFDLREERLLDPLGGLRDLRAGRLRLARPSSMREDPLRALRAARFVAQLAGFRLTRPTAAAAREVAPRLRRAAAERVREELDKLLLSPAPRVGLEALTSLGLLPHVLPELGPLRDCVAGRERPDVWEHTLRTLDWSARGGRLPGGPVLARTQARRVVRWSLLLHDISKPETLAFGPDGRPTFHGHETLGAQRSQALLGRLRAPRDLRGRVVRLVRLHLRPGHLADAGAPPAGLRRLVRDAGDDLPLLVCHAACDARGSGAADGERRWRRLRAVLRELLALHARAPARDLPRLVSGRDVMRRLNLEPGPEVGRALERVHDAQLEGRVSDRRSALALLDALRERRRP